MSNWIPEWYLPLLEKIQKNLNEQDLQVLQDLVNWKSVVDKVVAKKLIMKMVSWLNTWEKMKLWKMFLHLSRFNNER